MKCKSIIFSVCTLLGLCSCARDIQDTAGQDSPDGPQVSFEAYFADERGDSDAGVSGASSEGGAATKPSVDMSTKTSVDMSTGKVNWSPYESVSIFYKAGSKGTKYYSSNAEPATSATFFGSYVSGTQDGDTCWALYPYDDGASFDGESVTTTLASEQRGVAGTFDDNLFISIAKSNTKELTFRNICGGLSFSFAGSDVRSVTFRGNRGESLAGKVRIAFADAGATLTKGETATGGVLPATKEVLGSEGVPVVTVMEGMNSVTLRPASGECFEAGARYVMATIPQTLEAGFTVSVETSSEVKTFQWSAPFSVVRSKIINFTDIDLRASKESVFMDLVRATTSTAVVAWTMSEVNVPYLATLSESYDSAPDAGRRYRVSLYSDADCRNLLVGWDLPVKYATSLGGSASTVLFPTKVCPRFIFTGLAPATRYYVKVIDMDSGVGRVKPFSFMTLARPDGGSGVVSASAKAGDCILCETFDGLLWGGDMTCYAAGYSRYDRSSLTSVDAGRASGENPLAADNQFYPVTYSTEIGLFNTMAKVLDSAGIGEWGWIADDNTSSALCLRPGYVKVGANSKHASLVTPCLSAIPQGYVADITVKFKLASYGNLTSYVEDEKVMNVKLLHNTVAGSDRRITSFVEGAVSPTVNIEGNGVWQECTVKLTDASALSRVAFTGVRPGTGVQSRFMIDDIVVTVDRVRSAGPYAEGYVRDSAGNPQAGVSVSDGFKVAVTDADGHYRLDTCSDTWYIYISYPSDARITKNSDGNPDFYKRYVSGVTRYDFTYEKQAVENEFVLIAMADPQAHYAKRATSMIKADTDRFNDESVPAINSTIASASVPCYGVTLGDIVYSENSRNSNPGLSIMRGHFSRLNMPVFQTMGNHDYTYFYTSSPLETDATSSTLNLKVQRKFEECFGPVNFSFNRGNVHVVCMKDILYQSATDAASYVGGFTDEQWEWLKADLANVPKSKMVILCVHIPLVTTSATQHVTDALNLLKQYTNSRIFSGHTHYMRNVTNCKSSGLYEHVHSAVCGQWWWSNIEGDGCPNGYSVYDFSGTTLKDWCFLGVNNGMNARDYQMRVYRGDATVGGSNAYFKLPYASNRLLINVFNSDETWSVKVYENGVYSGNATKMSSVSGDQMTGIVKGSTNAVKDGSNKDWWSIGYNVGVVGRSINSTSTSYMTTQYHMWSYDLKNASASVRVEATDRFGRTYTCTDVITDTYSSGNYPLYCKAGNN